MNWTYKFAFDEIEVVKERLRQLKQLPWMLADDEFVSAPSESFINRQNEEILKHRDENAPDPDRAAWDWFAGVYRGRIVPELNLSTITTVSGEQNPDKCDLSPDLINKLLGYLETKHNMPGASIVSLIGEPHIIYPPGAEISHDILNFLKQARWNRRLDKYAAEDRNRLTRLLMDAWKITSWSLAGGILGGLLSYITPQQLEQQVQNGATQQQVINQVSPETPSQAYDPLENVNTQIPIEDPNNADFAENEINPVNLPETLDNGPETARIPREVDTRNLDGLDPMFAQQVEQVLSLLAEKGWQPRVAEGLRSLEQQQEKIDQGHSSLKDPQNSKHVQGLAVDIIDSRYGWNGPASDLNFQFWNDLGQAARDAGLTWGGDWKTFKDVAHVEVGKNTTGASTAVYRYAYKDIHWMTGKKIVRQFVHLPYNAKGSQSVINKLIQAGVPNDLFGRLYRKVYVVERSHAYAISRWNHKFAGCETG